jgi:hypothetical protein
VVNTGLIDQLDLVVADFIIGARPVFGRCGRGSVGTANGCLSDVVETVVLKRRSLTENALTGKVDRRLTPKTAALAAILPRETTPHIASR